MSRNTVIPSYKSGFARSAAESEYPNFWKGLVFAGLPFLGPTGLTLYEWSGYGNHGTLTNGPTWATSSNGWAVPCVAASSHYITLGDPAAARFTGAHSLIWHGFYNNTGAGSSGLLSKAGESGFRASGMQLYDDKIYLWQASNATTTTALDVAVTSSFPQPDMFVGTYDPGKRLAIYQNGVQKAEQTASIYNPFFNANGLPWNVQTRGDASAFTSGTVLAAALIGRALTDSEIRILAGDMFGMVTPRRRGFPAAAAGPGVDELAVAMQLFAQPITQPPPVAVPY